MTASREATAPVSSNDSSHDEHRRVHAQQIIDVEVPTAEGATNSDDVHTDDLKGLIAQSREALAVAVAPTESKPLRKDDMAHAGASS